MATIDMSRDHKLPLDQVRLKAEELAKTLETKLGFVWKWVGNNIEFSAPSGIAKGAKGELFVTDKNVRVTVDLPFMLRVMKGTIENKIKEKMDELL
jgi:putative polyhydroxyalkanoate system protein